MVEQGKERAEIECIDMTGESSERERNGQGPSPLRVSPISWTTLSCFGKSRSPRLGGLKGLS